MEPNIDRIDREILKKELNSDRFLRTTRKGGTEIYSVDIHNAPKVLQEIGRLRELTFRASGGGTGKALDLDEYDEGPYCYSQLIVWSPEDEEIIGGYRYILCNKAIEGDHIHLSTAHYFDFTERFVSDFLPTTIELGRSWVQPNYQPGVNMRKGLISLDNIWDGLGAIIVDNPHFQYFFGKVTMYPSYNPKARDILLYFMHFYFPDNDNLMEPKEPLGIHSEPKEFEEIFNDLSFQDGFKALNSYIRGLNETIPPLVNIYMGLSPTMKTFGTMRNTDFGDVEETGIMVTIEDVYPEKKERHINTYTVQ
jgi:hypothetical protein